MQERQENAGAKTTALKHEDRKKRSSRCNVADRVERDLVREVFLDPGATKPEAKTEGIGSRISQLRSQQPRGVRYDDPRTAKVIPTP